MSALSVLYLVLPLPLAFIIHVTEEAVRRHCSSQGFVWGDLGVLILILAITGYVLVGGPYAMLVWAALFVAFSLHLVKHVLRGINRRGYVPGLVTSILLLPYAYMGLHSIWLALGGWELAAWGVPGMAAGVWYWRLTRA